MLISLASVYPDPIALIRRLPSGWRVVYSVRRLLEAGRTEPAVTDFARELCDAPTSGRNTQELGERQRLLVQLAGLTHTPTDVLQELRTAMPVSPFTAEDHASAVAELFDEHLEDMLDLLARHLESEDDLAFLHRWVEHTCSWQGLLIARVYARSFDPRPIQLLEARELCEQMLVAIRALPASTIQQEYLVVYGSIYDSFDGLATSIPMLRSSGTMRNAIERSHTFALELLHHANAKPTSQQVMHDELVNRLATAHGKGWWNKAGLRLDGDSIGFGSSSDVVYVFPAVRLALVAAEAAENVSHPGDPAARFLKERNEVSKLLAEHRWELDPISNTPRDTLEDVLTLLETLGATTSRDERVRSYRGLLLLMLDRLYEAELELQECLKMPSCLGETRATALYNLGCVYVRTGRVDLCITALREVIALWPLFRQSLETDPDFITVRETPWFQELHKQTR
jgi:tetratricopeptide (TPR) repeat protein